MRTSQPAAITLLTCAALAVVLSSCTTKGGRSDIVLSMVTLSVATPPPPAPKVSCACPPPGTAIETSNVAFSTGFFPCLLVDNRMPNNGDGKTRLNTNDLIVDDVQVSFESVTSTPMSVPPQTIGTSGFIPANSKVTLPVTLVPTTLALPSQTMRIHFYLEGHLLDGSRVRTAEYEYVGTKAPGAPSDGCNY